MKELHKIREMLLEELEEYAEKGELAAGSLDVIHKLTDTIKNIDKIVLMAKDGELRGDDALMHGHAGGYDVRGRRVRERERTERERTEREHPSGSREHMIRRMMEMLSAEGDEKQKEMLHKWIEQLERE